MLIDLTLPLSPKVLKTAGDTEKIVNFGHAGTHFDVMNQVFPLEFTKRAGIVFDVSGCDEIKIDDIDLSKVQQNMFVAFYTGMINRHSYGSEPYFKEHPVLSYNLIDALLQKGVSIIALDAAGIRRGQEHTPADQHCADHGAFVIENLVCLDKLLAESETFTAHTYPINYTDLTGLPCRVIAEV